MTQGPMDKVSVARAEQEGADSSGTGEADRKGRRQGVGVELVYRRWGLPEGLEPFIAQRRDGLLRPQICWIYACNNYTHSNIVTCIIIKDSLTVAKEILIVD